MLGIGNRFENVAKDCDRDIFGVVWDRSVDKDIGIVKGHVFDGSYHVFAEQQARNSGLKGWMKVRDGLSASAFLELEVEGSEQ